MRNRISSHIRRGRFLFILIGLIIIYDLTNSLINNTIDQEKILVEIVFLLISSGLYFLFDIAKTVEFDADFMYVIGKKGEEKIPLKDVYKIKLTMTQINNQSMWKIGYLDKDRLEKSVRILPRWYNKNFDEFKVSVEEANKSVTIINWSHSFDFDQ